MSVGVVIGLLLGGLLVALTNLMIPSESQGAVAVAAVADESEQEVRGPTCTTDGSPCYQRGPRPYARKIKSHDLGHPKLRRVPWT